jgi:hypothetical protein
MIQHLVLFVTVIAMSAGGAASASDLVLADSGRSDYQIVLAENASPSTKHGAEELQMFLEQISGAKLPIVSDQEPQGPKEIVLGDNEHLRKLGVKIDFAQLGREGYVIRTVGDHLIIAGGKLRGNMYGVYGFLEDHLGCRWFTPGVSRIPKSARLVVGPIDERQVPALEYREPYLYECFDGDWCARNRMNSSAGRLDAKHGGKVMFGNGFFVHTFSSLVPPEKYFKDHPEYFSLLNGKRQNGYAQLCCTNPDVIRLCTEGILQAMRDQPGATVFSVSQNDCDKHCRCPRCQELARREGSQMGPVLALVNRVAEAAEKEFPDKIVETLAYEWTRQPPKHLRPRPNVVIRLCSIECCFSHPLATCSSVSNQMFRNDMEGWAKVAPRLWVWDYTTNFSYYLMPFPNQRVIGPNIRYFVAHNVKGIFEEDVGDTPDSELASLGGYVMAKCLWNPEYDANRAMNEFLAGYYGPAARPIRAYIDLLHDYAEQKHIHVRVFSGLDSRHVTDDLLTNANQHWQEAERLAARQPEVLRRVKLSRMSVDYAILERARLQAQHELPANAAHRSLAVARFEPFMETLRSSKITTLAEGKPVDKEAYRRKLAKDLGLNAEQHEK